jgi:hypothetical protein
MATDREELDVKIPSAAHAIVAEFADRDTADGAVDTLTKKGFGTDQISLVARGSGVYDGVFQPGVLMLTVHPGDRDVDDVMKMLREAGAHDIRRGVVSATGDVTNETEREREEATS